ncbi:MAG: ribonuclease P protein component [Clostridia bacterium]|nr:ribonuclease P protein component [Clostridia bacterium]
MNKTLSIKENHLFRALYHRGKSAAGKTMVVYVIKRRNQPVNRLGITVSVKLGCAVERNRARRRIRETYRLNETRLKSGFDIVIVARKAAVDGPFELLQKDLLRLCDQLGMLEAESHE